MITVLPFKCIDLDALVPQPGQRVELTAHDRAAILEQYWSFTAFDEQARPLMCGGAFPDENGVWWGVALLSVLARGRMLALSRATLFFLQRAPCDKVRIAVRWGFKQGHAWARLLGFSPLRELHRIEGSWCAIYERGVRHGV